MRYLLPLVFILVAIPRSEAAPPPNEEALAVEKVNNAINEGVKHLRKSRQPNDQWESFILNTMVDGMKGGVTALAVLALLNCGEKADDPAIVSALNFLRKIPPMMTYPVALTTMALAEARNPKDLPTIQENCNWLLKTAKRDKGGKLLGWGYPTNDLTRPDASNTQYALLGLYAGKQAGANIPEKEWQVIRQFYLESLIESTKDTAYYSYLGDDRRPSFPMTVAGVSGLVISRMGLDLSSQQLDPITGIAKSCGKYPENEAIRKGMNWIGANFNFEKSLDSKSTFYNVYGIERVGRLSGQRFIGSHDWYREGCDFLVKTQDPGGTWSQPGGFSEDQSKVIATSFALLFLSKGKSPVLISKFAHGRSEMSPGGILIEKDQVDNIIGWNRKHNDARNLTEFASKELFKNMPLGWQVYDPRRRNFGKPEEILAEVGVLVQSPILYFNGHESPNLNGQQKDILKKYIEEGGFVLAEACCGSKDFTEGFERLISELFPNSEYKKLPPNHAIWSSHFAVPPDTFPELKGMQHGCRTVLIFSPQPLAGFWEEAKYMPKPGVAATNKGEYAFQLAANIIAYATGMEPPKQRLWQRKIEDSSKEPKNPPKGFVKPAQILLDKDTPAPAAMRNLMSYLRDNAKLDVVLGVEQMKATNSDLFKFKFLYMHGKLSFNLDNNEIENVKANLQSGGLLLADACCGSPQFDKSFREMVAKLFPERKLEMIPADDVLYSAKLNGTAITSVKRREKAAKGGGDKDAGFEDLPPALEGIKIDGRWVIVYSKYDLGCALENHKSSDCLGHTPESARRLAAAAVLYSLKR